MSTAIVTEPDDRPMPTVSVIRHAAFTELLDALRGTRVPDQLHEGLARYLAYGIQPGSFLTAVLSGDLPVAIVRADDDCLDRFGYLVAWLYQHAPAKAWGSAENVQAWRASFARKPADEDRISCGCCRGPENDRCCCWNHQDVSRGLVPHVCSRHEHLATAAQPARRAS